MWPSQTEPPNTKVWMDAIAKKEAELKVLNQDLTEIKKRLVSDSLEATKSKQVYEIKVKDLRSTVAKLKANPTVIKVREESPAVDSLIVAQDSVIQIQEQRIAIHEYQYGKLAINVQAITDNFEKQIELERGRYQDQVQISDSYRKEVRKQRREKRIAIGAGVVGIVGALLLK